jgi:glutathione S-transferase
VATFFELNEIPYEFVEVLLSKGEHKTPEFISSNPFGLIPVIKDEEFSLGESHAILKYS